MNECSQRKYRSDNVNYKDIIKVMTSVIRQNVVEPCKDNMRLLTYMAILLISSLFNSVFFKKMTSVMPNHVWFLTQITTSIYIPLFGTLVLIAYLREELSEETLRIPFSKFWIIGFLDGFGSILTLLASIHTSGAMQVVLGQMCTPITLIMLSVICKDRFHIYQYTGAFIMILGILVVKSGVIFGFRTNESISIESSNQVIFNIIFVISCIPASASSVFKDLSFRKYPSLNENYLQFCVACTQVIVGCILIPINSLPILGPHKVELNQILSLLTQGANCLFLKKNTIVSNCGGEMQRPCDVCENAQAPVITYLIANIICNVVGVLVLKHGTAASGFIVSTLRLPLTTLVFFSPQLVGKEATEPEVEDFIGIAILIIGLVLYRCGSVENRKETNEDDYYELSSVSSENVNHYRNSTSSTTCSFNIEYNSKGYHSS
ncbi:transporter protein with conserved Zn ribbon C11C7CxxC [Cryptosporidium ryanae]|uniref:transporter protein with conserved Zn ribbon C11C7CxxC n=1 Tax=Cryptosporidium ryanae TaxID=515981 RepID=UPI00351A4BC0|nr:transporter protein with conserved Zn ribbon C11C7CxxC [Cryptosporidium ryanae]